MNEKENETIEIHDRLVHWRCPQLGGEVTFRYCRKVANSLPCSRIVTCWHTMFDIQAFLSAHYDPAQLEAAGS